MADKITHQKSSAEKCQAQQRSFSKNIAAWCLVRLLVVTKALVVMVTTLPKCAGDVLEMPLAMFNKSISIHNVYVRVIYCSPKYAKYRLLGAQKSSSYIEQLIDLCEYKYVCIRD